MQNIKVRIFILNIFI